MILSSFKFINQKNRVMNSRKIIYLLGLFLAFNVFIACDNEPPETYVNVAEASFFTTVNQELDKPDGFQVKLLAAHAPFPDDLAAQFRLKYAVGDRKTHVKNLDDASTMIVAEVNWVESGSTTGWHMHPGIVLVSMVEGSIEVIAENECIPRTYTAGDAWMDPGLIHKATAISDGAKAYATFLGIPNGKPATIMVAPRDCN